jgi:hypothetical protein
MKCLAMRLEGIQTGDIVEVDHKGRRFYAVVSGPAPDGLAVAPTDRRVNHYSARSREVVGHWVKRGRPKTTAAPLRPSERQLEMDLGIGSQADDAPYGAIVDVSTDVPPEDPGARA